MTATKRTDSAGHLPREAVGSGDPADLDAPGFLDAQDAVPPGVRRGPVWWARLKAAFTGPAVLFSLIWQVFLIYPILAVITADASTARTILGLVAIAAFSVIYLVGFSSPAVTIDFPSTCDARAAEAPLPASEMRMAGMTRTPPPRPTSSTGWGPNCTTRTAPRHSGSATWLH